MDTLLKFDNVFYRYPTVDDDETQPYVLNGVSLTITQGEFVAVAGHNGSGKSTLAKHMNAILTPTEGTVTVSGLDTGDENLLLDIRQTVGMVFQNPDNQLVATIVEEDVAFALENLGVEPAEIRRRVDEALEIVGMSKYREHAPHRLSGGQKQRVAIAGVVAMRPRCVVLDEPTAMLDPVGRREVMGTIRRLNKDFGTTVILITHHMNEVALCDRAIIMDKGTVRLDGAPRDVFSQYELIRSLGLAVPQTLELAHSVGLNDAPALTAEDCAQSLYRWILEG